jgi:hypothetical protein
MYGVYNLIHIIEVIYNLDNEPKILGTVNILIKIEFKSDV